MENVRGKMEKGWVYKLLLILTLLPVFSTAQENGGINFLKDKTWADAVALAKAENKLVFVDVYTDWCGPCKLMDAEVFPLPNVSEFYNTSFISYKLNAEKGEGIAFAKKYFVQSYPNYIFINGDGELIHRTTGYQEAPALIQEGKIAISESKQSVTLLNMGLQYPTKKKDKEFMFTYLERLTKIKAPVTEILEQYISLLSSAEQSDSKIIKLIAMNATNSNNQIRLGPIFDVMKANEKVVMQLVADKSIRWTSLNSLKEYAMENSLDLAIKKKNEAMFLQVRALAPSFAENKFENKFTIDLTYYLGTKNYAKYALVAQDFVNNYLLKIPSDSLKKWDAEVYDKAKVGYVERNDSKVNLEDDLFQYLHTQTIQFSRTLSHLAENLLKVGTKPSAFQQAKKWANYALEIAETDRKYYQNVYPSYRKVYTLALYKTGQKEIAIKELEKAILEMPDFMKQGRGEEFAALLTKMKTNKL